MALGVIRPGFKVPLLARLSWANLLALVSLAIELG